MLEIIARAEKFGTKTAIINHQSNSYSYEDLLIISERIAQQLLGNKTDLNQKPIPFITPSNFEYVATLFGIWSAGGIAVPLCSSHPIPEWQYVLQDINAQQMIFHSDFQEKINTLSQSENNEITFLKLTDLTTEKKCSESLKSTQLPDIKEDRKALIIYTSGSTGKPKGVVTSHKIIKSQIQTLTQAWEWTSQDFILNILPLHHIHGIVNVLLCCLWSGAKCLMLPRFDASQVWQLFQEEKLTLFMAVPTIYNRLIADYEKADFSQKKLFSESCQDFRLMISGSAALPVSVLETWENISKHTLLERYGMSEVGMAISNPYKGKRLAGFVGKPLPNTEIVLLNDDGKKSKIGEQGEIHIKGRNVFLEYWNKEKATAEAFKNGWFVTGDIATLNKKGYYKIVGRKSVDIIKTGGYKVSALEIEEVLRTHSAIKECAVVGLLDKNWGQKVAVLIVLEKHNVLKLNDLRNWAKSKLAVYKIPSEMLTTKELPKNILGKVIKKDIIKLF